MALLFSHSSGCPAPAAAATRAAMPVTEVPYNADSLVDSIGMNTHFAAGGNWATIFRNAEADLTSLGVRHIRDGWPGPAEYNAEMHTLAAAGIRADILTRYGATAADIRAISNAISPALESYEAPNEYDCSGDRNWVSHLTTQQHTLYAAVGKTYPVYGPALCSAADYSALGDLHMYLDFGNIHNYLGGHNPGVVGWGGRYTACRNTFYYGSIDFNLGCAEKVSGPLTFMPSIALRAAGVGGSFKRYAANTGSKPVVTTENGYNTMPRTAGSVDAKTQGKYLPRMFLLQFAAGIPRTYWYELIDEATPCASADACYGLTDVTATVLKPSFHALKGLIAALTDPGAPLATTPLLYSFSGGPTTLAHMLFQKRSGQYVLALWNETSSWNVDRGTGAELTVDSAATTVMLPFAPSGLTVKAFNDAGMLAPVKPTIAGNNVTFDIDDHVFLMSFSRA